MSFIKVSVLSLKEKSNTTLFFLLLNCPQVLKLFMTNPLNIILTTLVYDYSIIGSIYLSIYSTEASFHAYVVAMKYR